MTEMSGVAQKIISRPEFFSAIIPSAMPSDIHRTKFVFVTGGVVSSLGKGVAAVRKERNGEDGEGFVS